MRRYSSVSKAFERVTKGRADAPPCITCSIGVSTSRNPSESKVRRRLALTLARSYTGRRGRSRAKGGGGGGGARGGGGLVGKNEVEVAAAHAGLFGKFTVQIRQREQRFRRNLPFRHKNWEFTAAARNDLTRHEQVIAKINEIFPLPQRLLADFGKRGHNLDYPTITPL